MTTPPRARVHDRWIRPLSPRASARLRLLCLPYAGAGAQPYRPWPAALPDDIEVCAVCPPGREDRLDEPPYTRMEPLVEALARAAQPWLDRPFVLYGHSMGALVAYALARQLRRSAGLQPARIVVSGRGAPGLPDAAPPLRDLPDAEFIAALNARYNAIPAAVLAEPALLALFTPALRGDFKIAETYVPPAGEPLLCPITAVSGTRDPTAPPPALAAWGAHTRGAFEHHTLEGGHFFIQERAPAFLELLARVLRATR
jgi:medium-chain acyl-[acyl-carrier-protein] hydrolase